MNENETFFLPDHNRDRDISLTDTPYEQVCLYNYNSYNMVAFLYRSMSVRSLMNSILQNKD